MHFNAFIHFIHFFPAVIRILQRDVLANKYEWLSELQTNIEKVISDGKVQNIYICKNNEYNVYKE